MAALNTRGIHQNMTKFDPEITSKESILTLKTFNNSFTYKCRIPKEKPNTPGTTRKMTVNKKYATKQITNNNTATILESFFWK